MISKETWTCHYIIISLSSICLCLQSVYLLYLCFISSDCQSSVCTYVLSNIYLSHIYLFLVYCICKSAICTLSIPRYNYDLCPLTNYSSRVCASCTLTAPPRPTLKKVFFASFLVHTGINDKSNKNPFCVPIWNI